MGRISRYAGCSEQERNKYYQRLRNERFKRRYFYDEEFHMTHLENCKQRQKKAREERPAEQVLKGLPTLSLAMFNSILCLSCEQLDYLYTRNIIPVNKGPRARGGGPLFTHRQIRGILFGFQLYRKSGAYRLDAAYDLSGLRTFLHEFWKGGKGFSVYNYIPSDLQILGREALEERRSRGFSLTVQSYTKKQCVNWLKRLVKMEQREEIPKQEREEMEKEFQGGIAVCDSQIKQLMAGRNPI
jgi:hypothetical protein